MTDEELRMEAYYYGFDKTGQIEIDRILSAVACAGKAFHHTNDWNDEATPRTFHEGATPIDWIQNRAKEAADTIEALRAENARLMEELRFYKYERFEMTNFIMAKIMWDAYSVQAGGKTFDGKPLPSWEELGEERQACWLAAASAARAAMGETE